MFMEGKCQGYFAGATAELPTRDAQNHIDLSENFSSRRCKAKE
jgi:hypothetical protein